MFTGGGGCSCLLYYPKDQSSTDEWSHRTWQSCREIPTQRRTWQCEDTHTRALSQACSHLWLQNTPHMQKKKKKSTNKDIWTGTEKILEIVQDTPLKLHTTLAQTTWRKPRSKNRELEQKHTLNSSCEASTGLGDIWIMVRARAKDHESNCVSEWMIDRLVLKIKH